MALVTVTQTIIDWSRYYIPDPKTRVKAITSEELGRTSVPTNSRETFYVKHSPIGSVFVYIEPYKYAATASITAAATSAKIFQWAAATQSVIFPKASENNFRPDQFKAVTAQYEYTQGLPFAYSDNELVNFLSTAVHYLNNTYSFSFTSSGTVSTFTVNTSSKDEQELVAKALAIVVRQSFVGEQKRMGLGIRMRGPIQSIDSVAQMKSYIEETKRLEKQIEAKFDVLQDSSSSAAIIDVYQEDVVDD